MEKGKGTRLWSNSRIKQQPDKPGCAVVILPGLIVELGCLAKGEDSELAHCRLGPFRCCHRLRKFSYANLQGVIAAVANQCGPSCLYKFFLV